MPRTSDIPVLTLKNVGDGVTMRVTSCDKMKIGTYPEVEFIGVVEKGETVSVRVPQKSADRQLERLGFNYGLACGQTLTISRSDSGDPKKPFWDIEMSDAPIDAPQRVRPAAPAASAAPATGPSEPAPTPTSGHGEKKSALYEKITDHVLKKIVPKYQAVGIPITQEGTAAIVATLFINACSHH